MCLLIEETVRRRSQPSAQVQRCAHDGEPAQRGDQCVAVGRRKEYGRRAAGLHPQTRAHTPAHWSVLSPSPAAFGSTALALRGVSLHHCSRKAHLTPQSRPPTRIMARPRSTARDLACQSTPDLRRQLHHAADFDGAVASRGTVDTIRLTASSWMIETGGPEWRNVFFQVE